MVSPEVEPICERPIFVVGTPRSGMGTLHRALCEHPRLWGSADSDYLGDLCRIWRTSFVHGTQAAGQMLPVLGVAWQEFAAGIGAGINRLYTNRSGGLRWVDQAESHVHQLDDLAAMFPGSLFLLLQRDGRSVVDAMRRYVNPREHEAACREWCAGMEAGLTWKVRHETRIRVVDFGSLVATPERTLGDVYAFLDMKPSPQSVQFVEARSPTPAPAKTWLRWTPEERRQFQDIAGELLVRLGYEPDDAWVSEGASDRQG